MAKGHQPAPSRKNNLVQGFPNGRAPPPWLDGRTRLTDSLTVTNRGRKSQTLAQQEQQQETKTPGREPLSVKFWCLMPNAPDYLFWAATSRAAQWQEACRSKQSLLRCVLACA